MNAAVEKQKQEADHQSSEDKDEEMIEVEDLQECLGDISSCVETTQ